MSDNNKFYDANAAIQVIGCVLNDPDLMDRSRGYNLDGIDFCNDFHKVIFGSLLDLYENGQGKKFNAAIIEDFLKNKPNSMAIYKVNNGAEWLHKTFIAADLMNFNYYYGRLKKMTLLRVYNDIGLNLDWLYDPDNILDPKKKQEQNENLDNSSLEEIAEMIDNRISRARDMVVNNDMNESIQAGDGLANFLEHLQDNPLNGYAMFDGHTDKIALGARPGCFYLRSAATGTGKSRSAMADACYMACPEVYISDEDGWVQNENIIPTVFISVELDIEELWTMMVAFVSNVSENKIISHDEELTFEERDRIKRAIESLEKAPLYIEYLPDYTMRDIENCIRRNIREHKARAVFFDYLTSSMSIIQEVTQSAGGIRIREDQVLFLLASKIKDIAGQYKVFICSSTQLNGMAREAKILDQNMLAGAKAIANRIDFGEIMMDVTPSDLEDINEIIASGYPIPNVKASIYKNRRGKINRVICWMVANKGTCRYQTVFVTDYNFNLVDIDKED